MAKRDLPPELSAALRLAWALAARLGHACVGTEHLLLALAMQPQGADGRLLHWAGLTGPEIAAAVLRLHGRGAPSDVLPQGLTQAARRAVSRALNGTERLLTALLRESGGRTATTTSPRWCPTTWSSSGKRRGKCWMI